MALLPYHNNNMELVIGKEGISGIGDFNVMGIYTLVQPTMYSTSNYTHKVQLGGGLKTPSGKYNVANNGTLNPSF